MRLRRRLLPAFAALFAVVSLASANPVRKGAVEVELVSATASVQPGQPFTVALRMQHDEHWHSYWTAPGTGYVTALTWTLPPGFKAGDIQWPTPHTVRDTSGKITGNGFEGENFLRVEITPPADLAVSTSITLKATAEWLMCKSVCMPGDAEVDLTLPVKSAPPAPDAQWADKISATRLKLPVTSTEWTATATTTDKIVTLRLTSKAPNAHQPTELRFFAEDGYVDYAQPQTVRAENGGYVIEMPLDAAADKKTTHLVGVLASANGWAAGSAYRGWRFDIPFADAASGSGSQLLAAPKPGVGGLALSSQPAAATGGSLLSTLALAFVGGLILNLMPCVFPVLGIKILGFVNQAGNDRKKVALHGLTFALGVLISFWTLAGVLLVLRAGGSQLGWGFQLQSPQFVFGMAVFLLIFALNMSGLFEIGLSATAVGGELQMKQGYAGSFFTGALATLVATPCSAPFLAPALGAALSLSAFQSILVFTAIAVGLGLPYLLLSLFPSAIKVLPRPGAWMETFKQLMAFPLYATVGWLLWVLAGQTKDDDNALLLIAFAFVLVAMAGWSYGRFGQVYGKPGKQMFGRVFAAVLLAAAVLIGWPKDLQAQQAAAAKSGEYQVVWEKWSPEAIAAAQKDGHLVYVDFTARWCATCQTNKAAVFHNDAVLAALAKNKVVLLRGDWTNRDPLITAELARWNRSAVPFNLIYAPGQAEPIILPELLGPDTVLQALAKASAK